MSHEQHLALGLVARLAERFGPSSKVAQELPGWLERLVSVECPERPRTGSGATWWRQVRRLAGTLVPGPGGGEGELVARNASLLGEHVGLTPLERDIFTFMAFYQLFDGFEHVVDGAVRTREVTLTLLIAQSCGAAEGDIHVALRPTARLVASGLLHLGRPGRLQTVNLSVGDRVCAALLADVDDIGGLVDRLFPSAPAPDAEWQDFEGISEAAETIRSIVGRALATGERGIASCSTARPEPGRLSSPRCWREPWT